MATVVTKELNIAVHNSKIYCIADHLDLAKQTYAFEKYFNGSTDGYATLNNIAKNAIFPSASARPFKADSEISCSRSGGTCIVALQFNGKDIHSESFTSINQQVKSKSGIVNAELTRSTRSTQIRWHVHGGNSSSQRVKHVILKLYFNQYTMQAIGDGVATATVSNTSPYQGDSVIFQRLFQAVRPGLDGTQILLARYWSAQIKVIQLVRSLILHCMPRLQKQKLGLAYI